jgi:asparagine synthase (glutamine-hydrolysing)
MCGIAGCAIAGYSKDEVQSLAQRLVGALKHRGPDGSGRWVDDGNLLFTHNRLAVLDLSEHGHQPMLSHSGRYVLTFNGEIYNFAILKSSLEVLGTRFTGHSDTEVILSLVDAYGIDNTLEMIDGMFAFAIYDRQREELTIARDRMGEKPLFYGWLERRFVFSSELKAIKSTGGDLKINRDKIGDFLTFGYFPTPHSVYENIYKLSPGTSLTVRRDQNYCPAGEFSPYPGTSFGPKPFWDLKEVSRVSQKIEDPQLAVSMLEQNLEDTISRQLVADVPVGCFLSGGIDSSLVTALAQKQSARPIKTFTIGFDVEQFNEAPYAKEIARHLGTDHHETYVKTNDVLELISRLPQVYDEPFADPSQLPSLLVAQIARKDVTVCLSGDGGDELFAGYNRYRTASRSIATFRSWPTPIKKNLGRLLLNMNSRTIDRALLHLRKLPGMSGLKQANLGLKLNKLGFLMRSTSDHELYLFLLKFNGLCPDKTILKTTLDQRVSELFASCDDFITTALLVDQLNYLVDDNLTKVDRSAMSVSLETRLPLLDRQIVELSWRIPTSTKIWDNQTKWPLREILYKHVPKSMIERPKMGFSVPISAWLRNQLKSWSRDLIKNPRLKEFVNVDHYYLMWEQHQEGTDDNGLLLWPVLVFSQWLSENS